MPAKNEDIGAFIVITTGLILLLILFIILILFLYKRRQFNFFKSIELLKNDYEKSLLSARLELQEQALEHISLEIHDNLGSTVSLIGLSLRTIDWNDVPGAVHKVDYSLIQLAKTITDLKHLSKTMNPDYVGDNGIEIALGQEVERIKQLNLFNIRLEVMGEYRSTGREREVVIFRMVQEAINNSISHAHPTELHIRLDYTGSQLGIQVSDNGKGRGSGEPPANGLGLKTMEHRTRQLNGTFVIENNQPRGTNVHITIPFEQAKIDIP